jgi:hypothetical protein
MGHERLETSSVKISSVGMHRMGSNPSSEMGGSSSGRAQRRMRAKRRASVKASSVAASDAVEGLR